MRKLLSILMACCLFIFYSTPVFATPTLDSTLTWSKTGGGSYTCTVPYTGNYDLSVAGTSGACYGDTSGGSACTITQSLRFNAGDVIKVTLCNQPSHYTSGSTLYVPKGNDTLVYMNDTLILTAPGGQGSIHNSTAPSGVTSVITDESTYTVHWHNANCPKKHVCDSTCRTPRYCGGTCSYVSCHDYSDGCDWHDYHYHIGHSYRCTSCGSEAERWRTDVGDYSAPQTTLCGKSVVRCTGTLNTWNCGYTDGQIVGTPVGEHSSVVGQACFSLKLANQNNLMYSRVAVRYPSYLGNRCDLILRDKTVLYYKRS